jgi:hypothetical protein
VGEYGRTGKPITANMLARLLKPLGIIPRTIRTGDGTSKGTSGTHFKDVLRALLAAGWRFTTVTTSQRR